MHPGLQRRTSSSLFFVKKNDTLPVLVRVPGWEVFHHGVNNNKTNLKKVFNQCYYHEYKFK